MDEDKHQNNEEVIQALDVPAAPPINTDHALDLLDLEGSRNQPHEAVLEASLQLDLMRAKLEDKEELHDHGLARTRSSSGASTTRHPPCGSSPPRQSSSFSKPSSTLLASLKDLEEHSNHSLLPQSLHWIAEAYFLEKDYERAVQFLQLERLYHERLLSNLAALQEKWEGHCTSAIQDRSSPMGSEEMDALRRICRTHQRPSLTVPQCASVDQALNSTLKSMRPSDMMLTLCTGGIAENRGIDHLILDHGRNKAEEKDALIPSSKGEVSPYPDSSSEQLMITPISALGKAGEAYLGITKPHTQGFAGDLLMDSCLQKEEEMRQVDYKSGTTASWAPKTDVYVKVGDGTPERLWMHGLSTLSETENKAVIPNRDSRDHVPPIGWKMHHMIPQGKEPLRVHPETHPGEEEWKETELEEQELADDEVGDETLECDQGEDEPSLEMDLAGVGLESLDELAKRIQVEEINPADGLVSILKRRVSLDADTSDEAQRQTPKRKVRFKELDDGLDQDEVGGASCLVLLLLCLVTVVISMGGTAIYCLFGDEKSSVCTDFSHNMDLYLGHVWRGVDELKRWFSPASNQDVM